MSFKKFAIMFLTLLTVIVCSLAISACDGCNDKKNGSDTTDHVHSYVDYKVTKSATCTEDGEETAKCTQCDKTNVRSIPATGHTWGTPSKTAATCLTEGYTLTKCSVCNAEEKTDVVPATGHKWNIASASCTVGQVCETCQEKGEPATGHVYGDGVIKVRVSCENDGVKVYECTVCHDDEATVESVYAEATGHDLDLTQTFETHEGCVYTYSVYCNNCDKNVAYSTETIHTYKSKIKTPATCSTEGVKVYTCSVCDDSHEQKYTDPTAHLWNAGETNGNVVTYTCTHGHTKKAIVSTLSSAQFDATDLDEVDELELDGATLAFDSDAKGTLAGNISINAGTLSNNDDVLAGLDEGYANRVNGSIYDFTLEANNQALSTFGGKVTIKIPYTLGTDEDPEDIAIWYIKGNELTLIEATYSEVEGVGYAVFETDHFSLYTVTRMTPQERCELYGHNAVSYKQNATCITSGYDIEICSRCKTKIKNDVTPALGHKWGEAVTTKATCTVNGSSVKTCERCEITLKTTIIAVGHVWVLDETKSKTASCTASGKSHYDCEVCKEAYEVTESQKAHRWQTTVVAPTCTAQGYTLKECATCKTSSVSDYKDALGHDLVDTVIAPTCTEAGFTKHECSRCGYRATDTNVVAALGHDKVNGVCSRCGEGCSHKWQESKKVEATCTEGGYTLMVCSKCKSEKKENVTQALGHSFGVVECSRCHTPNPALADYYNNLLASLNVNGFAVKVTGIDVKVEKETFKNDESQGTELAEHIKQLSVTELMLSVSSGTIFGAGYGTLEVELGEAIDEHDVMQVTAKIIVDGNKIYAIADMKSNESGNNAEYLLLDFDSICGTEGLYESILDYYDWAQSDALTVVSNFVDYNSKHAYSLIKGLLGFVFADPQDTADGYKYVLDFDSFSALSDDLATLTVPQLMDKYIGEGSFKDITDGVKTLLTKNVIDLFNSIEDYGVDYDGLCTAVDELMKKITGAEEFDTNEMLKEFFAEGGDFDASVAEIIASFAGLYDEEGNEMVTAMAEEYIELLEDLVIYDLIPVEDSEMINSTVKGVIAYAKSGFEISFTTDKKGNLTSFDIDAKGVKLPVGGGNYGSSKPDYDYDYDYDYDEDYSSYKIYATISGKITLIPNGKINVDFEEELIKDIQSHVRLGKNISATASSSNYYSSAVELRTDGYGNIISLTKYSTEKSFSIGSGYEKYEGVAMRYEDRVQLLLVYSYNLKNGYSIMASSANICKSWMEVSVIGQASVAYIQRYTRTYINLQTYETVASVQLRPDDREESEEITYSEVGFYYDTKTNAISLNSPHKYAVDRDHSVVPVGCTDEGYWLHVCSLCGDSYKEYYKNGHRHQSTTSALVDGAESCEDGAIITTVCLDCGKTLSTRKVTYHYNYEEQIDATKYGSKCGGYIQVYRCACGRELNVEWWGSLHCEMMPAEDENVVTFGCAVTDCPFKFTITHSEKYDRENCKGYIYYDYAFGTNTANPYKLRGYSVYDRHDLEHVGHEWTQTEGREGELYTITGEYSSLRVCKVCDYREGSIQKEIRYFSSSDYAEENLVKVHNEYNRYENDFIEESSSDIIYSTFDGHIYASHEETSSKEYRYGALYYERTVVADYDKYGRTDYVLGGYADSSRLGNSTVTTIYYEKGEISNKRVRTVMVEYNYSDEDGNLLPCYYDIIVLSEYYNYFFDGEVDTNSDRFTITKQENHVSLHRETVSDPTCTQDGVMRIYCDLCGYEGEQAMRRSNHGHEYDWNGELGLYECRYCGLQNYKSYDGAIILEDLTTNEEYEEEGYYVIGYNFWYNSKEYWDWEWLFHQYDHPYGFSVFVTIIDAQTGEEHLTEIEATVVDNAHSLIYVSMAQLEELVSELGIADYQVLVELVLNDVSGLSYNITLDPSEYV